VKQQTAIGVLESLERDHDHIRRLLAEVEDRAELDPWSAVHSFARLAKLLETHAAREQATLYSALAELDEGAELAEVARSEHEEISEMLADVRRADDDDTWWSSFSELKSAVEQHLQEEVDEIFALASSPGAAAALARVDAELREQPRDSLVDEPEPEEREEDDCGFDATVDVAIMG
jgi:hypothetical protein